MTIEVQDAVKPHRKTRYIIQNSHDIFISTRDFGQRAADKVARIVGSWRFIIIQSGLILLWVFINTLAWLQHWDPYPFILMNLMLSMQAALTAPIIMMSQNRQSEKDRIDSHNDYQINLKAEQEIRDILNYLQANEQHIQTLIASTARMRQQFDDLNSSITQRLS